MKRREFITAASTSSLLAVLSVLAAAEPVIAQDKLKSSDDGRQRINKAWDAQLERMWRAHVEADCKEQARKQYSAIHFKKRRTFLRSCIEQARR